MTYVNEQNEQRVAQAIAGDKEAFGDLYEQFLDAIYRYIYFRVNSREDAEDLTETVFLRAWDALGSHPPREIPFRLWLYRIAHNIVVDHYRMRKDNASLADHDDLVSTAESPEAQVRSMEEASELSHAIRQLKEEHQQVLACRFYAGLSHKETAQIMIRDEQAVRALQYRAINNLRNLLINREGFHV